jgi:hypothetical protein
VQFTELIIGIVAVTTTGSVFKAYIDYKQKALEAKTQNSQAPDNALRAEMAEVKQKLTELRDVTTQYDMSFDSALHRVESRLANVEQRLQSAEETNTIQVGR